MALQASTDGPGMLPPTTETVTSPIESLHPSMNDSTAGYASSPKDGRDTRTYSSEDEAFRLTDTASSTSASSGTMSLPLIRLPRPLVSRRILAPVRPLTSLAMATRSSSLSVGSPYPQNTISSASGALAIISDTTSSTVGSLSSQRSSASPRDLVAFLTQNTHLHGHRLVMLTYQEDP